MKNSRTVELHISAHDDDDVTEHKKINYRTNVNATFYCQRENSSMERKCQGGRSHNSAQESTVCGLSHIFSSSYPGNVSLLLTRGRRYRLDCEAGKLLSSFNCWFCTRATIVNNLSMMSSPGDV